MIYVILADGDVDQIVETQAQVKRERRDLEKMGCEVKVKPFPTWAEAEAYVDKRRGY